MLNRNFAERSDQTGSPYEEIPNASKDEVNKLG
jgi:hypothetical protein